MAQQLCRNKYSLPTSTQTLLVNSLILPYFDYSCSVYDDFTDDSNSKLERTLNSYVRFIYILSEYEKVTPNRLEAGLPHVARL